MNAKRIADIRAWRDQTAGVHRHPHAPWDSDLMCNNKAWWRDVDTLLQELDAREPETVAVPVDFLRHLAVLCNRLTARGERVHAKVHALVAYLPEEDDQ